MPEPTRSSSSNQTAWLTVAIASGACAAFNGVFAKLTTTEMTSSWAGAIAGLLGLDPKNQFIDYVLRAAFFGLNLLFNAIMWGLFTRALTLASSTVRVSVINTSANFFVTAVLGALIFSEALPGLWWVGAALLVAGSVIIGRRDESVKAGNTDGARTEPHAEADALGSPLEYRDNPGSTEDENVGDGIKGNEAGKKKGDDSVELQGVESRDSVS